MMDEASLVQVEGFLKDKDHVYFRSWASEWHADGWFAAPEVDAESFVYVGESTSSHDHFYKDKDRVYRARGHLWQEGSNPDPATFVFLGSSFFKDKNSVFHDACGALCIISSHPESFEIKNHFLATDQDVVYIWGSRIENSDSASFEKLDKSYYKDKNLVYYFYEEDHFKKTLDADAPSFFFVDEFFARDNKRLYYRSGGSPVTFEVDAESFERVRTASETKHHYRVYKDKSSIYILSSTYIDESPPPFGRDIIIRNVEVKTFDILSHEDSELYIKHKGRIAYLQYSVKIIPNADFDTFEPIGGEYAKDKNRIFFEGKPLEIANRESFKRISKDYYADKDRIYHPRLEEEFSSADFKPLKFPFFIHHGQLYQHDYKFEPMKDADAETFSIHDTGFAWDKNHAYCRSVNSYVYKRIEDADGATFEPLITGFGKDKNHVFFCGGREIEKTGFDAASFRILCDWTWRDNYYYSYCFRDKNGLYFGSRKKDPDSSKDLETFEVLSEDYSRDKNHVYRKGSIMGKIVPGDSEGIVVDVASFEVVSDVWSKDKNHVYNWSDPMPKIDPQTFRKTEDGYVADKNAIYNRDGKIIKVLKEAPVTPHQ
jgi:hypothetical protein